LGVSWTKLFVNVGGKLDLSLVVAFAFLAGFGVLRASRGDWRLPRIAAWLAGWSGLMLIVDLLGLFNIDTAVGRTQFGKAFLLAVIAAALLICATTHMAARGPAFTRRVVGWFIAGFVVSAAYSLAQFGLLSLNGHDLDRVVIDRIPLIAGGTTGVLYYGGGIFRVTGLMLDTNHLGVVLIIPLALAAGFLKGWQRLAVFMICGASMLLTLSRSGMLGAGVALLVLAIFERRRLMKPGIIIPVVVVLGASVLAVFALVAYDPVLARQLFFARLDPNSPGVQSHINLYGTIPPLLMQAPLFGLGLNSFALHFIDISGREEFGPHSMWIKLLVENGLIGTATYIAFAVAYVRRLVWVGTAGATAVVAAFIGTLSGNLFYLTTHFMCDEIMLAIGGALVYFAIIERATDGNAASATTTASPTVSGAEPPRALASAVD
ncbi:MAG: O-antigen ligase family protein, partial [Thermoleophilia bacterium]|nr:O-antigen ligase family protein [Thermoleophilia bacterium]